MKNWKLLMACLAAMSAAEANAGDYEQIELELSETEAQTITGANASLLLGALPPAPHFAGAMNANQQQKHFRSLFVPVGDDNYLTIQCADADWEYRGHGRTSQMILVQATPNCKVQIQKGAGDTLLKSIPLMSVLGDAAAANSLAVPALPAPQPIEIVEPIDHDCPPNSRICL